MSHRVTPLIAASARRAAGSAVSVPARYAGTVENLVASLQPVDPLYVIWPERVTAAARKFVTSFPGEVMYAVKANPDKTILQTLFRSGVRTFDVASIEEVRLVRKTLPKAKLCFMHPVKSPEAIREAYHEHGVRTFVIDCQDELYKILRVTDLAPDLTIFVRLALPRSTKSAIDFSYKFGALPADAAQLLQMCRPVAAQLGLCFHVGSQMRDAAAYGRAVSNAAHAIRESGVSIDLLDVGGGFAVPYPGQKIPSLNSCIQSMARALKKEKLDNIPLLCEPGRALVAEAGALIVRVEQRKDSLLYINDGTYGGLFDAGPALKTRYPVRAIRDGEILSGSEKIFSFAGPTCDSLDMMPGPFVLPAGIKVGDWIEIGNMGAYSAALRSNFNGFGKAGLVFLKDVSAPARV